MSSRWYQKEAVDAMLNAKDNGVVVLPTGSGKSHVLRDFAHQYDGRVLILSHVKEILEQNFNKLAGLDDIGLWSAGLSVKKQGRVTVAGIQSVYKSAAYFRSTDVVLIDEAHLVSNEGMYKQFLSDLNVPYMGLTATDFRLKGGYIHGDDGMFDSVLYEAPVDKLTEQGYLCPLVYYGDQKPLDTKGVKVTGGDYNLKDMSLKFNRDAVTYNICQRIVEAAKGRKHILIFCIDIEHAINVQLQLCRLGLQTAAVHSKSPRDMAIQKFKGGEFQALTNVNILTTGFDAPFIDMICILRPTKSLSLHQQMLGRGMRVDPSKNNTLIKDYTNNTKYLGTVADPVPIKQMGKGKGGENPFMKSCPKCDLIAHPSVRKCKGCGHEYQFRHNLKIEAATGRDRLPKWYQVDGASYTMHNKPGSPPCIKASYRCGLRVFTEYVGLEHGGWMGHKAKHWVSRRYKGNPKPTKSLELLKNRKHIKKPIRIQVEEGSKYPKILSVV